MDQLNKGLTTFAAYNAGPGRIRQLRSEAQKRGLPSRASDATPRRRKSGRGSERH
jgi:membrane-bound lytic murein transglycosylase MltF